MEQACQELTDLGCVRALVGLFLDAGRISYNHIFLVATLAAGASWTLFMFGVPRWPMPEEHAINSKLAPPAPDPAD